MTAAISVSGLSKRYLVQSNRAQYSSLGEAITERLRRFAARGKAAAGGLDHASYGREFWAVKDISFEVAQGERVGVIGRNGAGKSTLLKLLSRITDPTEGRIKIRGRVSSLLEVGTGFHPELNGRENIYLNGAVLGLSARQIRRRFDEIVAFAEVERFLDMPVKRYSSGMYVRLAFAVAAHLDPQILIIDEVLAVGDAAFQRKCVGRMEDVSSKEGRTILFVSHNMVTVENLCSRGILLEAGRLVGDGPAHDIVSRYLRQSAEASRTSLRDRSDRQGSGEVRFSSVTLRNAAGEEVKTFRTGEPATLSLEFARQRRDVLRDMHVVIAFDGHLGEKITILSSELSGTKLDQVPPDANCVDVIIDRLPLMPGRYGFALYAALSGVVADWIQNAGFFDVEPGDFYRSGHAPPPQGQFLVDCRFASASHQAETIQG